MAFSPTLLHILPPLPPPQKPTSTTSAVAACTSNISALARCGYLHSSAASFSLMLSSSSNSPPPNHVTFLTLISACSSSATFTAFSLGFSLHSLSLKLFPLHLSQHSSLLLNSALFQFYSKLHLPYLTRQLIDRMPIRNSFTFNSIIACYMNHYQPHLALSVRVSAFREFYLVCG